MNTFFTHYTTPVQLNSSTGSTLDPFSAATHAEEEEPTGHLADGIVDEILPDGYPRRKVEPLGARVAFRAAEEEVEGRPRALAVIIVGDPLPRIRMREGEHLEEEPHDLGDREVGVALPARPRVRVRGMHVG